MHVRASANSDSGRKKSQWIKIGTPGCFFLTARPSNVQWAVSLWHKITDIRIEDNI
jgi:hypothetical protein